MDRREAMRVIGSASLAVAFRRLGGELLDRRRRRRSGTRDRSTNRPRYHRADASGATTTAALYRSLGLPADAALTADLRSELRQRIVDDHRTGRVVELDGWLLSETEAQLATLAADASIIRQSLTPIRGPS
ncbi:MAG: hypothetical protein IPG46_18330 [Actinobacteria bacterium]|nr:hypothetical protein [Actinomycetota bacterium]